MSCRVGSENIAGVATAIALGGPGARSGCGQSPSWARRRRSSTRRSAISTTPATP
ncbi:alanine:cation symporter family protein [Arthrobacter rhizosphaerae]|uniref:alanine:cation symporter family protein n=1 Tax=Arthrobacter rhizosphaerae TaxID=2855490 RepID=UPI0027DFAB24|nr:alanine:cation symporter family protein [Arthrobacter rhizosphaerae]